MIQSQFNNIKLILTDIDGVWTDGGMIYSERGDELKKFHISDGGGVALLKAIGLPLGFVTGENSIAVKNRAEKLKIEYLFLGCTNKYNKIKELCEEINISFSEIAYIGDDINCIPLLKEVGFSACPSNSPEYIKKMVHKVLSKTSGDAVFREFVEYILTARGQMDEALNNYLKNITK